MHTSPHSFRRGGTYANMISFRIKVKTQLFINQTGLLLAICVLHEVSKKSLERVSLSECKRRKGEEAI